MPLTRLEKRTGRDSRINPRSTRDSRIGPRSTRIVRDSTESSEGIETKYYDEEEEEESGGDDCEGESEEDEEEDNKDVEIIELDQSESESQEVESQSEIESEIEIDFGPSMSPSKCKNKSFAKFRHIDSVSLIPIDGAEHSVEYFSDKENKNKIKINFQGPIEKPLSKISEKEKRIYNKKILEAQRAEERGDYERSFRTYLEALEVCDEDAYLHGKLAYISQELDLL